MKELFKRFGKAQIQNVLGVMNTVGSYVLLYIMLVKEIPVANKDILLMAIGFVLGGSLPSSNGFFFGASKKEPSAPAKTDE